MSEPISTIENYHVAFKKVAFKVSSLLNASYSPKSDMGDIMDHCIIEFLEETNFTDFSEVYLEISNIKIQNIRWDNRKDKKNANNLLRI